MGTMRWIGCGALALLLSGVSVTAQPPGGKEMELPTVAEKLRGLKATEGLLRFYKDPRRGKLWLEVPAAGERGEVGTFLYYEGVLTGIGSNPIGIDRGQLGGGRIVTLRRLGGRLLVEQQNLQFRALSADAAEKKAVHDSFATSVLWAGELAALDADGRAVVDFTPFLLRDAHGVVQTLKQTGQGNFSLDVARSALDLDNCLVFPQNVELEALLTFSSSEPGPLVRDTAPAPEAVSLVAHHSFVRLPEAGYEPRAFDPRAGSYSIQFLDYAAPIADPLAKRWIVRHRLQKRDPAAASSPAIQPIVFYVDRAAPEPIRSALVEGASWWSKAFAAAGFPDGFRVEVLPAGAHPLDLRYNVVQWVHRSTRGWSYGGGIIDPRSGEMLKGHVSLGSLRVRQDRLIFEALFDAEGTGKGGACDPQALALWRLRQLAAHEVGHALGFSHNYAASTYGDRASVMDYPPPRITVGSDGKLRCDEAYGVGVGEWDVQAVRYAYSEFSPGADEAAELAAVVRDGLDRGLLFLTDADARPLGSAHPLAHLWDDGPDPVATLEQVMAVREVALAHFGAHNLGAGRPLAELEEVLVPLYLYHRYQLEAASKLVAGVDYRYAFPGDGQPPAHPVAAEWQRRALAMLLRTLDPAFLDLPEDLLGVLPPRPSEYERSVEQMATATPPTFDALGAAVTAADLTLDALFEPARAARLVDQHRRDEQLPELDEVIQEALTTVFAEPSEKPRRREIRHAVQAALVGKLSELARLAPTPGVRSRVEGALGRLAERMRSAPVGPSQSHRAFLAREIDRFLARPLPTDPGLPKPLAAPPGSPIGGAPWLSHADGDGCSLAAGAANGAAP